MSGSALDHKDPHGVVEKVKKVCLAPLLEKGNLVCFPRAQASHEVARKMDGDPRP